MATTIRPEISVKNKYWIDRHRYYELKHFCLQYPTWKKLYLSLDGLAKVPANSEVFVKNKEVCDPTAKCAEIRNYYLSRMKIIEQAAIKADAELANYILKGVTEGYSYDSLLLKFNIPCCKDTYYNRYRRFFYFLDKERR